MIKKKSSLHTSSNGAFGKATSLFLRGADSSYTLIVIDGVEYNDKSSVGGAAILEHIELSSIEKIEILKGSQSVLYGSDAMAGVIRITTKTPGKSIGSSGSIGYGSYDNKTVSVSSTQKGKLLDYAMGISFQDVEGISSYNSKLTPMAEKDGMSNLTATFRAKKKITSKDTLEFNIRGVKAESDFDSSTSDELDYMSRDSQVIAGVKYKRIVGEYWIPELSLNFNKSDRLTKSFSLVRLISETKKIELFNPFYLNENITLINGVEYEDTKASIDSVNNKKEFSSFASFIDTHFVYKKFTFQAGVRWTKEKIYTDQVNWKSGFGIQVLTNTQLKMNVSNGFKAPSLYQLYSSYGNDQLSPTTSKSYDLSLIQNILDTELSIVLFKDQYENVIDFESSTNKYMNTFKSESKGIELKWNAEYQSFSIDTSATLLRTVNLSPGVEGHYLARRPREKYFLNIGYKFNKKFSSNLDFSYVGERENSDFDTVVLRPYSLVGLQLNYDISLDQSIHLKIGNLLNEEYEEVHDFGTAKRNFFLKYNFKL